MRDEELLRRYLLGLLPEEELPALEKRLLEDDTLADLAEVIESEILEEYARGGLSPGERRRVADYLRSSPAGRVRLSVVQGLGTIAAETKPGNGRVLTFPPPSPRTTSRFAATGAVAAMLVMLLGGFWAIGQRAVPGPGVEVSPAVVLALDLFSVRGAAEIPELVLPRTARRIELRLNLARGDGSYPSYRVALLDETGADVLRQEDLRPARFGDVLALPLSLDASRLRDGRYVVEVRGATVQGGVDDLAFQEFQLRRT